MALPTLGQATPSQSALFHSHAPVTEHTPSQYHIQTDDGDNRFFKYSTYSGQFRKEAVTADGSVVGSYGWVDANGILRVFDYVADKKGYRIVKTRLFKTGGEGAGSPDGNQQLTTARPLSIIPTRAGPLKIPFSIVKPIRDQTPRNPFNRDRVEDNFIDDEGTPGTSRPRVSFLPQRRRSGFAIDAEDSGDQSPSASARLQRRVLDTRGRERLVQVEPLFDFNPEPTSPTALESQPQPRPLTPVPTFASRIQPRGEGSRVRYSSSLIPRTAKANLNEIASSKSLPRKGGKSRRAKFGARLGNRRSNRRYRLVKRRRRPNNELEGLVGSAGLDYQTGKAFHKEKIMSDGQRKGEYGYIDPFGIRRVVTYATGPGGELVKSKENDFVGENTYFQAS